jgi:repressor LexA
MSKYELTRKQKDVYDYIKTYIDKNSMAPYIREIQDGCGIVNYKSAVDKLLALEKKGYIKRSLNKHRSIALTDTKF